MGRSVLLAFDTSAVPTTAWEELRLFAAIPISYGGGRAVVKFFVEGSDSWDDLDAVIVAQNAARTILGADIGLELVRVERAAATGE